MALRIFSAGAAWERAFDEALAFLGKGDGVVLLGPGIGDSGKAWLEESWLAEGVRFGARIQKWDEWVKARARDHALSFGRGFRVLDGPGKRELLKSVTKLLSDGDGFHHLKTLWQEENFFSALLDCVETAREAGLDNEEAIEHAKELLASGQDAVAREAYEDFWALLKIYEIRLSAENDVRLDYPALLKLAAESGKGVGEPLFLLGFDELTLRETELVQELAKISELSLPLALEDSVIAELFAEKVSVLDLPAALSLRGLLTGFTGEKLHVRSEPMDAVVSRHRLLLAHSPAMEARAAAALGRVTLPAHTELRYVVPEGYFDDRPSSLAFREELGLPLNFHAKKAIGHPVARLFFHALELKEKGFTLAHGLELAQLLEFTQGLFGDLASRAAKAGVRGGLYDWQEKAGSDRELRDFATLLKEIDANLPSTGTAEQFAQATETLAKAIGLAELARRAPDSEHEREAHAALSAVLRNARKLATSTHDVFSFPDWMVELKSLLRGSLVGEVLSLFPRVQFFEYGEWLPPATASTLTVALGLDASAGPRQGFQFFLEEAARRKLSDLLLPTQVQAGILFLDQVKRLTMGKGPVLLSYSLHDGNGGEQEPSWVTGTLDLEKTPWPEVPRDTDAEPFCSLEEVKVGDPGIRKFSASLFELYKTCPFKAFAEKVLRLEDKVQESTLDLSRLEEGSFVHKVLELFYGEHDGKQIAGQGERERVLDECLLEARKTLRVEYFKGNEALLDTQLRRLRVLLLDFLALDAENYTRFPFFGKPEPEKKVSGALGKYEWEGKIDRVDYDERNKRFLVIDYKIGGTPPPTKEVNDLEKFQLQLYADAVEKEKPGFTALGGLYASVASGERSTGFLLKEFNYAGRSEPKPGEVKYYKLGGASKALHEPDAFESLRARTRMEAERLASKIEEGDFSVRPLDEEKSCKRCSVRPACRIRDLRSPPTQPWPRPAPLALSALLEAPDSRSGEERRGKQFNVEQRDALDRRGRLVFIEASAGTGKTTVIVERIRLFLAERMEKEAAHLAVERFAAISFTEKSAQELRARVAQSLLVDDAFGPRVAAQAQQQVSTIHGFCRRILSDFPVEAGISPLATMLDQKGAEALRRSTLENFFLFPEGENAARFQVVFAEFSRGRVEELLVKLVEDRLLLEAEVRRFRAGEEGLFSREASRPVLEALLALADELHAAYTKAKRDRSALDFNDLEALSLKVLESETAREYYQKKFELLLVDEFQDTNSVQREIFGRLARPDWSNVFVVGDAKQSIYRFRAADVSIFQNLRKAASASGDLVTLGRNYRSRKEIVEVANRVTTAILPKPGDDAPSFEAFDSPAIPELPEGGKVALIEYGSADEELKAGKRREYEATLVARLIRRLREKDPGKTIAVLLRKVNGNEFYLRALADHGISCRVGSSKGFYGQSVIIDSIALLRVLYGAKNDIALLALLRSPWGRVSDSKLLEIQRRGEKYDPLWDKLAEGEAPRIFAWKRLATHSSLASMLELAYAYYPMGRREQLQGEKLIGIVDSMESEAKPRQEIIDLLSAWAGWDREDEANDDGVMPEPMEAGSVQVMTVHAAKGLEFDITILADLCATLPPDNFPLRTVRGEGMVLKLESEEKSPDHTEMGRRNKEREVAELKRLFYVAITRAKREEYFFLPRWHEAEPDRAKWDCCADFLRASDLSGAAELIDGDSFLLEGNKKASVTPETARLEHGADWPQRPNFSRFRESSITELAAFKLCPHFHFLKYVQGWDDNIVGMWPRPRDAAKKTAQRKKKEAPRDPAGESVAKLLKALKIERKERGIALHRVLERVKEVESGLEVAPLWLREAYEAQGVSLDHERLPELIELDVALLRNFLLSPLGLEFFDETAEAFPEITFQWRVGEITLHGAMDRLIRKENGAWVVVDYKSSIHEESLERYRFQVASYMAAVQAQADSIDHGTAHVDGYLIDLYSAQSHPVPYESNNALRQLGQELESTSKNYTATVNKMSLEERGIVGGEHCLTCPYCAHCKIGQQFE